MKKVRKINKSDCALELANIKKETRDVAQYDNSVIELRSRKRKKAKPKKTKKDSTMWRKSIFVFNKPPMTKVERKVKEAKIIKSGKIPKSGHVFKPGSLRMAGDYLLGPVLGSSPVKSMVQCLARKKNTDEFYTIKILTVKNPGEETQDDKQGKMLLHTEHALLSFLNGQTGVLKEHGLFQDYAFDGTLNGDKRNLVGNGKIVRRVCLVLDCVIPHPFNVASLDYINLQHYVLGKVKLKEFDALTIFYNIVLVVKSLHDLNVVHRDLKLANLVLSKKNRSIILTNFCLGQHLVSENDKLLDQRGSPAYISPDVLIGKPYLGKPSDMWALGVVLFTMLYGQFPFYHKFHLELFNKIKAAQYNIPNEVGVKGDTIEVIRSLLCLDPLKRASAEDVLIKLTKIITARLTPDSLAIHDSQVVPEIPQEMEIKEEKEEGDKNRFQGPGKVNADSYDKDCNLLDYFIQKGAPHPENNQDKKQPHSFGIHNMNSRVNMNTCYSMVNREGTSGTPKESGISVVEGELRTFTKTDLSTHRRIFPQYLSSDVYGIWGNPSAPPQSHSAAPVNSGSGRGMSRGTATSNNLRMPSSRLSLPSLHISPSSNSSNMYEFPPIRKWALAVLQQNNPNEKSSTVPQLEQLPQDGPSSSPLGPASESLPKNLVSESAKNQPSSSGCNLNAREKVSISPLKGKASKEVKPKDLKLENPGPSGWCGYPTIPSTSSAFQIISNPPISKLSLRRLKRLKKCQCRLLKNNALPLLQLGNIENDSSSSSSSSSNSCSSTASGNSCNSYGNEPRDDQASGSNASFSTLIGFNFNSPDEINILPLDDNNNNEDNNNNNDDNNNSESNNLNVTNANNTG